MSSRTKAPKFQMRLPPVQERLPHSTAYGRMGGAGSGGGMGTPQLQEVVREFRRFNTDDARAAFADKWVRLTTRQMNSMWAIFYELLRIIRDRRLYENPAYMEDHQTYATFEDYWAGVIQKPFTTWIELEDTYRFVQDHAPALLAKPLSEAISARASERSRIAARATKEEDILPADGFIAERLEEPPEEDGRKGAQFAHPKTQSRRAARNGVSRRSQQKIDRLARDFPEQIARVRAGEVTVHRASVEAGFVKDTFSCPKDPAAALRVIVKHYDRAGVEALVRGLANHAGIELVEAETIND